jgi:hypothetical protein
MHFFITAALILAYGLLLIFALLHVLQSLIARPAPWLAMALEAGDERQDESSGHSTSYTRELGGNAHARVE